MCLLAYTNIEQDEMKMIINTFWPYAVWGLITAAFSGASLSEKRLTMMPLTMTRTGEETVIRKVGGKEEIHRHLENLGFVAGAVVTVVSEIGGNLIVNIKDTRVAIGKDMANKILVG